MVYAQPGIRPKDWNAQNSHGFWDINGSLNLSQTTRPYNNQKKKKKVGSRIVDFAVSADHWVKLKESEKKAKDFELGTWKKQCDRKVMVIPIVIGVFGTVTKILVQGLGDFEITGRVETTQTTALLRSARILQRVLETWGDLLSLNLQWKTIS